MLWCVLVSIALHVLVLLGVSPQIALAPPAKTLLVLTARLAPVAITPSEPPRAPQPVTPVAPPPPAKPVPEPPPPKPVPVPKPVLSKPAAKPEPAPQRTAPVEAPKPAPPEPAAAVPAPSAPPAAPGPLRSAPQTPVGASSDAAANAVSDADKGTLEKYRLALIVATRRYKRYPAIAMEKGWQGKVEVHMVIGANGMVASASIKSSSGHEILDNQAMDMLKKGKTTVQIPASLRGREFSVDVPVIFNLENPNS